MSDTALQNALDRRGMLSSQISSLQQQLTVLQKELKIVDEFVARWHTFAVLGENEPLIQADDTVDNSDTERKRPVNPPREEVGDVVESLLREWGRPASRARLFAELSSHGIIIQGANPEMVFSTMLWRMKDRFERVKGRGYWLKGEPIPAEAHDDLRDLLG